MLSKANAMKTTKLLRQLQARSVAKAAILDRVPHPPEASTAAAAGAGQSFPRDLAGGQQFSAPDWHQLEQHWPQQQQQQQQQQQTLASAHQEHLETQVGLAIKTTQQQVPPATSYHRDPLDLSFNDTNTAYKSKTLRQLMRNYFVLGLCSNGLLVRNNEKIMKLTRSLMGKRAFELLMRATFYGQFVAGQDEREIVPVIKHLSSFGVKTILDYSAEEDVAEESSSAAPSSSPQATPSGDFDNERRKYLPVARTYFYHGESQCEKNLEIFFKAIEAVANTTGNTGFAAIKLTALGRPKLLMRLSTIIDYMRQLDNDNRHAHALTPEQKRLRQSESLADLLARFEALDESSRRIAPLDEDERELLANLMRRVSRIAAYASQVGGARCMIDAEQTYMQPAINMIAMDLMRRFNRREAIIFNTYQCYLKSAHKQVLKDLAMARRESFYFGAKLVRGAYMDQERARAAKFRYEDPINESFEATTQMYEKTLAYLMGEIERELKIDGSQDSAAAAAGGQPVSRRVSIMVASHNEATVRFALEQMRLRNIRPEHKVICFGQLYGMCDHVSFTLGQSGYSVYKYTPYGPIEEVLPYLGRRAIENHGFLDKLARERNLLATEILQRLTSMRWFYKPLGNYRPV